ncbi:MAG: class I SAM-dependent methyltransferase [Acetobacteraceae bacterium]|nr:class I SAM-dependent methyltransferase [Acetobacteraceae bacterium]
MALVHELCASMDALAAIGAELRRRRDGLPVVAPIRDLIEQVIRGVEPDLLTDVTADQQATALGIIESFFRQAADLLDHPGRPPGWSYDDPVVIDGQGMTSRAFVRAFENAAAATPGFAETLARPGAFLDVGAGAGWLAIEVARCWPAWTVVAIDRWVPALELARRNIAAAQMQHRITLRRQDVRDLDDRRAFSLAWVPGPFLAADAVCRGLERLQRALVPGGWLVFSLFATENTRWGEALRALKVVRNGGYPWKREELETMLADGGFVNIVTSSLAGSTITIAQVEG